MPGQHALAPEVLETAMRRAIVLALRGPAGNQNPQVGCVILDALGNTVAEGWHEGVCTMHAETAALAKLPSGWVDRASELTAVVTLEPCNHTGHTGPCAVALAEAGIGAVVYALSDPGRASSGGADTLRRAGVAVSGGLLEHEVREFMEPWLAEHSARAPQLRVTRPFITVKWAQTLDGRAAASDGSSQWITGALARADVHRRRAAADAIVVGTGTLLADDPSLTARTESGELLVPADEQPVPVVVGHRPIPENARVRSHPALGTASGTRASGSTASGTRASGSTASGTRASGSTASGGSNSAAPITLAGDDLVADMHRLQAEGIHRVFVEGGPQLASSFIRAGLADELLIYIAPALLGGPMLALGDIGAESIGDIRRLTITETVKLGEDFLVIAHPTSPQEAR